MNTNKIQKALTIIQEAIDEVPDVTLTLDLTDREAEVLTVICMSDISVPRLVVKNRPTYFAKDTYEAEKEVQDLLGKIKDVLDS